ncbi:hypothetical protein A5666_29340 [Mycolicibacterium fortuitum]|uniref:phosphatase PAP2 family protein n=1 Tax=Mycolicibacterium fortuitum TaxID=1766 RepID=UPI0007EADA02|nr:phosphatase PAP2 family protein [Mycolicibacterium fortuitum]OBA96017.1 hypothetical protein A5665_29380 [Mycolicibacterium fortuitum]OBI67465.1 hypothetical protein A5666_29340 [Mycolicibacterium fortuitum]
MKTRDRWLIVSAAAAAAVYAVLWIGYASQWARMADLDAAGLAGPYRYGSAHPAWVTAWDVLCTVLGPFAFRLLAAVLIAVALLRRQRRIALFLFLTIELSGLTTELAKFVVDRPRPATAMVHALGVLVAVLALSVVAWPGIRPSLRLWWALAGVLIVIAVGVGRVVLNVHHPSDVVAGWALGYVWFVAIYLLCPPSRTAATAAAETPVAPGSAR